MGLDKGRLSMIEMRGLLTPGIVSFFDETEVTICESLVDS